MTLNPYAAGAWMGGAPAGGRAPAGPSSRYILPQFEERTSYGMKRQDPYTKLFEDRIIFLGVQVDDASADDVMAQLLVLESLDPDGLITMYINSPGGSFTALTAIYDTMQYISPQIQTVCLGQAASAAAVLLAAGSPGKRLALPNARVLIHQPALSGGQGGQASDLEIQAAEVMRMRTWLEDKHLRGELRADRPVAHSYKVEARDEEFVRVRAGAGDRVWRRNEIWRSVVDRRTGDVVGEELVKRNCAVVKYPPPEHLVLDLDEDGRPAQAPAGRSVQVRV